MDPQKRKFTKLLISNTLILSSIFIIVLTWTPILKDELTYQWRRLVGQKTTLTSPTTSSDTLGQTSPFGKLLGRVININPITITPVDTNFGLVIEKIDVNAPVIKAVDTSNPESYNAALRFGVAQAAGTALPSDPRGNVYIFAHSSLNFWQLGRYATIFNLLRKLDTGDKIHVFYENRDYEYSVIDKQIYPGFNTYPLERRTIEPILTLQTCDPPGTTLNRLVVTAKLVGVN